MVDWPDLILGTALMLIALGIAVYLRRRAWHGRLKGVLIAGIVLCASVGGALLCWVGFWFWFYHRPQPKPLDRELFAGVRYIREVIASPRPVVIHVVTVELDQPGIAFLVTPSNPAGRRKFRAQTTSRFLGAVDAQVAINANYFTPHHISAPWDYYPRNGDPVDVSGPAASRGELNGRGGSKQPVLNIGPDNRAEIVRWSGGAGGRSLYNAISGHHLDIGDGPTSGPLRGIKLSPLRELNPPMYQTPGKHGLNPVTAVALDKERKRLIMVVVDGRQPNYSEGVTPEELGHIIGRLGGVEAITLDGGGSSTLVLEGPHGRPKVLNSPVDRGIPGFERPVANHLGIFAKLGMRSAEK